jgi:hypothetical protein
MHEGVWGPGGPPKGANVRSTRPRQTQFWKSPPRFPMGALPPNPAEGFVRVDLSTLSQNSATHSALRASSTGAAARSVGGVMKGAPAKSNMSSKGQAFASRPVIAGKR